MVASDSGGDGELELGRLGLGEKVGGQVAGVEGGRDQNVGLDGWARASVGGSRSASLLSGGLHSQKSVLTSRSSFWNLESGPSLLVTTIVGQPLGSACLSTDGRKKNSLIGDDQCVSVLLEPRLDAELQSGRAEDRSASVTGGSSSSVDGSSTTTD